MARKVTAPALQNDDPLAAYVYARRAEGWTFALICREGRAGDKPHFPYTLARRLGKEYDARHGKPSTVVRRLPHQPGQSGPQRIPARELRNDSAEVLRQVEAGQRFLITVSGRDVAELTPLPLKSVFVPRSVIEDLIREAPLDRRFAADLRAAIGERVDDR